METCPTCEGAGVVPVVPEGVQLTCSNCGLTYRRSRKPNRNQKRTYCDRPECRRAYARKRKDDSLARLASRR